MHTIKTLDFHKWYIIYKTKMYLHFVQVDFTGFSRFLDVRLGSF